MVDSAYLQSTYMHCVGAALFSLVFFFLWRQSGVIYFAYWSLAWVVESLAWVSTGLAVVSGWRYWLDLHALLEFAFAVSLVTAARVGASERNQSWRAALRVLYFLPTLVLALELIGRNQDTTFFAFRALVLGAIYFYCFRQVALGSRRLFHFTLLALSLLYFHTAPAYLFIGMNHGVIPPWMSYMRYISYVDLALKTVLAFSAMAMWIENQNERLAQLSGDLERVRRESDREGSLDTLTGLLNQDCLRARMDSEENFKGVAAVCDLDDFKSINDRFGHVVGDEVLRNVGNLLRTSVRAEDFAFRWGGDEFAILFSDREKGLAHNRMLEIEARLRNFRVRGYTSLQISFSWGVAAGDGVPLREVLEEADREMYASKRGRERPVRE